MCACFILLILWKLYDRHRQANYMSENVSQTSCLEELFWSIDPPETPSIFHMLPGYDRLFILHYNKLKERRTILQTSLAKMGLDTSAVWVDWLNKEAVDNMDARLRTCLKPAQGLSPGLFSLNLKHFWVYWYAVRHNLGHVLVLEDDPSFTDIDSVVGKLRIIISQMPPDYMIAYVGSCATKYSSIRSMEATFSLAAHFRSGTQFMNTSLYGPGYPSRCANGYIISQTGAKTMLQHAIKASSAAVDDIQTAALSSGSYWLDPPLWKQTDFGGRSYLQIKGITTRSTAARKTSGVLKQLLHRLPN